MSLKKSLSVFLSFMLCSSPFRALAESAIQIRPDQVPAISSLQDLSTLPLESQTLEQGRDYDVNVQYSADQSTAYVCYTFKNGYSGQVVKKHVIGEGQGFPDVDENYYAAKSIGYSNDLGWVKGREDGNFYPTDNLTRGEFVTLLYRLCGQPQEEVNEHFTDIDTANPGFYTWPALWAAKHGIIKGYTDKYGHVFFKGDKPISRQELAVMLHRYQGEDDSSTTLDGFIDAASVGDPYLQAMKWCVEHGIISGSDGYLNPWGNASRAQAVTMLERLNKAKYQSAPVVSAALSRIQAQSGDFAWLEQMPSLASSTEGEPIVLGTLTKPEIKTLSSQDEANQDSVTSETENEDGSQDDFNTPQDSEQDSDQNSDPENNPDKDQNTDQDTDQSTDQNTDQDQDISQNETDEPDSSQDEEDESDVTREGVVYGWNGDGKFISFESGEPQKGWLHLDGSTYYFDEQGNPAKDSYRQIGDQIYHLDAQGKVTPGFVLVDNKAYYFSQYDGHSQKGKKYYDRNEYRLAALLGEEGLLNEENGNTICLFSDGSRARNEELTVAGAAYYFDGNGNALKNQEMTRDGKSYFYGADGKKLIGQAVKQSDGKTIYYDFYDGRVVDETEFTAQQEAKAVMDEVGTDPYTLFMWIVHNFTFTSEVSHELSNGEYGRIAFEEHKGNCYVFTAAFYYFTYLLGYDPIFVRGEVMYDVEKELWGDHSWCAIRDESGKLWYYDPDSERNIGHIVSFWHVDPYHLPANLRADPDMLP